MLLVGHFQTARLADDQHPFGYGKDLNFWVFQFSSKLIPGG
jgi:hypothetical protein